MRTLTQSIRKAVAVLLVFALISSLLGAESFHHYAQNSLVYSLRMSVDDDKPKSGETFTYTITYGISGTNDESGYTNMVGEGVSAVVKIPSGIEILSWDKSAHIKAVTKSDDGRELKFDFRENTSSGVSAILMVNVRYSPGTTKNNAPDTGISVSILDDGNERAKANSPGVRAQVDQADSIEVKKSVSPEKPVKSQDIYYVIDVKGEPIKGGRNLENVSVVDELPKSATDVVVVSPEGGTYDPQTHKVTWNNQNILVGEKKAYKLKLRYTDESLGEDESVVNTAKVAAKPYGMSENIVGTDSINHNFFPAQIGTPSTFKKLNRAPVNSDVDEYGKTQVATFRILGIKNSSNVAIEGISVLDTLPKKSDESNEADIIALKTLSSGIYSEEVDFAVWYKLFNGENFVKLGTAPAKTPTEENVSIDLSSLDLSKVEAFKFVYGGSANSIPVGFVQTQEIVIKADVVSAKSNDIFKNKALLTLVPGNGKENASKDSEASFRIVDTRAWYQLDLTSDKEHAGIIGAYDDQETIEFTASYNNHKLATGDINTAADYDNQPFIFGYIFNDNDFENYSAVGTPTLTYSIASAAESGGYASANKVETMDSIKQDGQTIYRWKFTGVLRPEDKIELKFSADLKSDVSGSKLRVGRYGHRAFIVDKRAEDSDRWKIDAGVPKLNESYSGGDESIGDSGLSINADLDENGDENGNVFVELCEVFNKFQGQVDGKLYVKGERDANFQENGTSTLPGGKVNYKLRVANDNGNGPIKNVVVVDKLPKVGDLGIISSVSRNTKWNPYLIGEVSAADSQIANSKNEGTLLTYYSTKPNPDISILRDSTKEPSSQDWSQSVPSNITEVTHIMFVLKGYILEPGDYINVEFPMIAQYGSPIDAKAFNSFAYGASYDSVNGDESFVPSEPAKVYHQISTPANERYGIGNRIWHDKNKNGLIDTTETDGFNGIKVLLYKSEDSNLKYVRSTYTTDAIVDDVQKHGYYAFPENLQTGNYDILFLVPKSLGLYASPKNVDVSQEAKDSDFALLETSDYAAYGSGDQNSEFAKSLSEMGNCDVFGYKKANGSFLGLPLGEGREKTNVNMGLYKKLNIGGYVFDDANHDGLKSASESGISGVRVKAYAVVDGSTDFSNPKAETQTDENGRYEFDTLDPGQYQIEVVSPDAENYLPSIVKPVSQFPNGGNRFTEENVQVGQSQVVKLLSPKKILLSEQDAENTDCALHKALVLGRVFHDADASGSFGAGDANLSGIKVYLLKDGNVAKMTTTATNGTYAFVGIDAGTYSVAFASKHSASKHYTASEKQKTGVAAVNQSTINVERSNISVNNSEQSVYKSDDLSVGRGNKIANINAGFYMPASLVSYAWEDLNGNGLQDAGEPAIQGLNFALKQKTDGAYEAISDSNKASGADGKVSYTDLKPGTYRLVVEKPQAYANFTIVRTGVGTSKNNDIAYGDENYAHSADFKLASNQNASGIDAGLYKQISISGEVFIETGLPNGIKDVTETYGSEMPMNMKLYLKKLGTSGNGIENYELKAQKPIKSGDYSFTFDDLGLVPGEYRTVAELPTGYVISAVPSADASGVKNSFASSSFDFRVNSNVKTTKNLGIYKGGTLNGKVYHDLNANDNKEETEPFLKGKLLQLKNQSGDVIASTTTKDDGSYSFVGIPVGTYNLAVVESGFEMSTSTSTLDFTNAGTEISNRNYGIYKNIKIFGRVYEDATRDGTSTSDKAFDKIKVQLLKKSASNVFENEGDAVSTSNGNYSFSNIKPGGVYKVKALVPENKKHYILSKKGFGNDKTIDFDVDPGTALSDELIAISSRDASVDIGVYRSIRLSGVVNGFESGSVISGAKVELLDEEKNVIKNANGEAIVAISNDNGAYVFNDLPPANYILRISGKYVDASGV